MKKTYIQPEVKEIKINLPAILAADSLPGSNGYTLSDDNNIYDPTDPAEDGDGSDAI